MRFTPLVTVLVMVTAISVLSMSAFGQGYWSDAHHDPMITSDQTDYSCLPGDQVEVILKVRNNGNIQDSIKVEIDQSNFQQLVEDGWAVMLSTNNLIIDSGEERTLTATIVTPSDWREPGYKDTQDITFIAYSEQAALDGINGTEREFTITIKQEGASAIGFEPIVLVSMLLIVMAVLQVTMWRRWYGRKR